MYSSVGINQNQGGSVYPFDGPYKYAGLVSDISVVSDKVPFDGGAVYVVVEPSKPRLIFYDNPDEHGTPLLDTENLTCQQIGEHFWYFHDARGRNTVRYSVYAEPQLQCSAHPNNSAKLVSRCWSCSVNNVYYDAENGPVSPANRLTLDIGEGLSANVSGNTITLSAVSIMVRDNEGTVLRSINNIKGDSNNNFNLEGDGGCIVVAPEYDDIPDTVNDRFIDPPNALTVRNDCKPCCSCEDYAEQFEAVNRLTLIHNYEAAYLKYLIEYYTVLQNYYNSTIDERLEDLVQIRCIPTRRMTTIGFSVSNPSGQSLYDVKAYLRTDNKGSLKRAFITNAILKVCNHPNYDIEIPELKAHSTWTGAVSVVFEECGNSLNSEFWAELPWHSSKVQCSSDMPCSELTIRCPNNSIKEPVKKETVYLTLPTPPLRSDYFSDE